ncbi:MAG: hypothetical protein R3E64_09465 [Halioglobus sp.]
MHRATHFAHHRYTNKPEIDPDKVFRGERAQDVLRGSLWIVPAGYVWYFRERVATALGSREEPGNRRVRRHPGQPTCARATGFPMEVLILSVIPNLLGVIMTATLFAWIVHHPHENQSRWGCASTFDFAGRHALAVTIAWLWQNYPPFTTCFRECPSIAITRSSMG